jgi:hypothetical protein
MADLLVNFNRPPEIRGRNSASVIVDVFVIFPNIRVAGWRKAKLATSSSPP